MQSHGRAVAERQDKACAFALFGADGAEEIGRRCALVVRASGRVPLVKKPRTRPRCPIVPAMLSVLDLSGFRSATPVEESPTLPSSTLQPKPQSPRGSYDSQNMKASLIGRSPF